MAILRTTSSGNFNQYITPHYFVGELRSATENEVILNNVSRFFSYSFKGSYFGNFSIDEFGRISGEVDSFQFYYINTGGLKLEIREINSTIEAIFDLANSEGGIGILSHILREGDYIDVREFQSFSGRPEVYGFDGNDTVLGSLQRDTIFGGNGDDALYAGSGDDQVAGEAGSDTVVGDFGDDTLNGGLGDDLIIGGYGIDVAVFDTEFAYATISYLGDAQFLVVSREGTDLLEEVEFLEFTDGIIRSLMIGTTGPDSFFASTSDDIILAGPGNDSAIANDGNDRIDLGEGVDTVAFSGDQASYTLTVSPTATTLTDRRADGSGTDTLLNVEYLDFGGTIGVGDDGFGLFQQVGIASLGATDLENFVELYIAYFNRAPDAEGLGFWGTAFANGFSLETIAGLFIDQDETRATYPDTLSNADFAAAVYNNALGRLPDQSGFDFWAGALDSGGVSQDQFILQVLRGAKVDPQAGATQEFIDQQLLDRQYLADKTDIGAYFSVHKGMSNVADASAAMALFDGSAASIAAAVNVIDGFYADALNADTGAFLIQVVGVIDDPFAL